MKKAVYIFSPGELKRKDNTILYVTEKEKKVIPVETVDSIYIFGETTLNKKLLEFLSQKHIPVHFFNYFEYYVGTYYPREYMNSGLLLVRQVEHYLNPEWRLGLARAFVYSALSNMLFNLRVYASRGKPLKDYISEIESLFPELNKADSPLKLMAVEGRAREIYYKTFDLILENPDFSFETRTRRPPANRLNALISFGNSLLYTTTLSEIYRTHLDPRIGYLHETNERSFSLNLDISEVFKPLIVDRVIFSLINRREIKKEDFHKHLEGVFLSERGMKKFIQAYEKRLSETIMHKKLGRKVSYKRLLRLECYKLYKHFLGEEVYIPFIRTR